MVFKLIYIEANTDSKKIYFRSLETYFLKFCDLNIDSTILGILSWLEVTCAYLQLTKIISLVSGLPPTLLVSVLHMKHLAVK